MRGEDALFDKFAVSYVGRSDADSVEHVRHTSREDSHSSRDEHAEETPSDTAWENTKTRGVVRASFDAETDTFTSS